MMTNCFNSNTISGTYHGFQLITFCGVRRCNTTTTIKGGDRLLKEPPYVFYEVFKLGADANVKIALSFRGNTECWSSAKIDPVRKPRSFSAVSTSYITVRTVPGSTFVYTILQIERD